ncbi:hypothetical protein N836_28875 [Leptolyngbya sp. Heron Island J]|uniref:hypothetical protein n=1 Tax=Leptolyngbya sp. Heron Island J TaxID=1385935 RepID=UPI0003B9CE27|nr:hypothetical protein [Leptolyngbya sp. Heron Island J]ESA39092.1 hypothetical protein N836_28875 [Leptolyngbya sp. Heron Island J]
MVKNTKVIVKEESAAVSEADHLKKQMKPKPKGFKAEVHALDPKTANSSQTSEEETVTDDPVLVAIAQLNAKVDQLSKDKDASDARVTELETQLEKQQTEAEGAISELKTQLEEQQTEAEGAISELKTQHQQELETVQSEKQEAEQRTGRLEGLLKLSGNQHGVTEQEANSGSAVGAPNVNTLISANRTPKGMFAEVRQIIERAPLAQKYTAKGAITFTRDNRELNAYIRQARLEPKMWRQFLTDIETYAKAQGMLRGSATHLVDQNAATTGPDIDGGFLATLAAMMRSNNRPQYIFRNFANTRINFQRGFGETIKIPRVAYQTGPNVPDDRLLSGSGAYTQIDSTNQRMQSGTVSATIEEWGLGKNSQFPPIAIPTFVDSYSMIDLMRALDTNLGEDYYRWEDMKVRSLWAPTSRVVYNDGDQVSTTASNADGSVTLQYLNNLYAYMRNLQIPTYQNGCYGIVLVSSACATFRNELVADGIWQAPSMAALEELANNLSLSTGLDVGPTDLAAAYQGKYGNFHIWETNAYASGAVGTAGASGEGVQTETVAAGAATTRTNYAFGANTIGRGIGTEMEIRRDTNDDFQRVGRYIWRSEEGFVAMDVDPTGYNDQSAVPQQLRVLDVRTIG